MDYLSNRDLNWEKNFYIISILFFLVFLLLSLARTNSFSTLQDLAYYNHAIWYTTQGKILYTTISTQGFNTLGNHMMPILLLITPFYYLLPSAGTLLFFQSLALVLASIPIFRFSREHLKSTFLGFLVGLAYLCHPTIWYNNLNDFHVTPFGAVFASFSFYFLSKREYIKSLLFILLLLLCKEDLILVGITFGIYILWIQKNRILGMVTSLTSAIYFILTIKVFMPFFSRDGFNSENFYLEGRYEYLGKNISEVVSTIITNPLMVISNVVTLQKLLYLFTLFLPGMFLSLLSPGIILIVAPIFAVNLLSTYYLQNLITTQYSMVIVPFIYFGAVVFIKGFSKEKIRKLCMTLLLFSVLTNLAYGPPPQGIVWKMDLGFDSSYKHIRFLPDSRVDTVKEFIDVIPPESSVLASPNLLVHIPSRETMFATGVNSIFVEENNVEFILLDTDMYIERKFPARINNLIELTSTSNYELLENKSGYVFMKKIKE